MPKKTYEELLGLKKMQEIALERLHPPMAPPKNITMAQIEGEPLSNMNSSEDAGISNRGSPSINSVVSETSGKKLGKIVENGNHSLKTDSTLAIDFNNMPKTYWVWCDRLETKRTWYHARFDKVHRGSVEKLKQDVQEREIELDAITLMKKSNEPAFVGVMQEFKNKVAKLRERSEKKE